MQEDNGQGIAVNNMWFKLAFKEQGLNAVLQVPFTQKMSLNLVDCVTIVSPLLHQAPGHQPTPSPNSPPATSTRFTVTAPPPFAGMENPPWASSLM